MNQIKALSALQSLQDWWGARMPREKLGLSIAAATVAMGLIWGLGLLPAWRTLQKSPDLERQLQQQLADVQTQARIAQDLKNRPSLARNAALAQLEATVKTLGSDFKINIVGDQAIVTMQAVHGSAMVSAITQLRTNAQLIVREVKLQKQTQTKQDRAQDLWSGSLTLNLPIAAGGA